MPSFAGPLLASTRVPWARAGLRGLPISPRMNRPMTPQQAQITPEQAQVVVEIKNQDRREQARWLILVALMAGALYLCWLMLAPFVGVLLWAAVFSYSFAGVHRRILERVHRPNLAAALSTLLVVLVIGLPMVLVAWAIIREIVPAIGMLQEAFLGILDPDAEVVGPAIQWLGERVDLPSARLQISEQLSGMSSAIATRSFGIVGGVLAFAIQALFVVFVMFYLFRDRNRQTRMILHRVSEVVTASINGVLVIAAIQGALGGLAFAALGLASAVIWGVVMIFLSLIPIAGAFIVWIPAAIYLAVTGAWIKALLLTLWGVFVISLVDNFLRPRLVGKRAKLHELFIFFAVLGGLQVFGLVGIVLGPVILAVALSLFESFRHPDLGGSNTATDMFIPEDNPYRARD